MLKRLVTAAVLLPLVLYAIFYLSTPWIFWLGIGVFSLALWEWMHLVSFQCVYSKVLYLCLVIMLAYLTVFFNLWMVVFSVAFVFWVCISLGLIFLPLKHSCWRSKTFRFLSGLVIFVSAMCAVYFLHQQVPQGYWLFFGLLLVWVVDMMGFVVGKTIGKHLLAPRFSPKKTWEGAWAGILGNVLVFFIMTAVLKIECYWVLAATIFLVSTLSIFGDLFESVLKRVAGVKDSGALLPGHGGMLDRVDGVLAALPSFAFPLLIGLC